MNSEDEHTQKKQGGTDVAADAAREATAVSVRN